MSTPRSRPRILITRAEEIPDERWEDYAACIERAGGDPIAIDVRGVVLDLSALPPHDGLLVTAGVDVDPSRYGETRSERVREVNPTRDEGEEALIAHARTSDLPLFAVCRGYQIFNTSQGGSLVQHLEDREPHRARLGADGSIESGWHDVEVQPESLLARVTGTTSLRVNSRHHQAITPERLAPGLVAGAAHEGVVESVEDPSKRWQLGVQWHPERPEMTAHPEYHAASVALFEAFVAACAAHPSNEA